MIPENINESTNIDEEQSPEKNLDEARPVEDVNVKETTQTDSVQEGGQTILPPPGIPYSIVKTTLKSKKKKKSDWKNQWKALQ